MERFTKIFVIILGIFLLFAGISWIELRDTKTEVHKVLSISKVEATQGDSEGFYTEVYYLVSTDKGAYKINTIGFNAAPECAGLVPDSTYILTTRGTSIPYLGKYKNIIRVVPDWTKPI